MKIQDIKTLFSNISQCKKCERLVKTRNIIVNGYGDLNAQSLFIGEAPGRLGADITGVPFTRDKSGKLLQDMLFLIGMKEDSAYSDSPILKNAFITNVIRCNPRNSNNNNGTPKPDEILNCSNYLAKEIEIIDPFLIIPLGATASRALLGNDFNGKCFGYMFFINNRCIFPLWHPAFITRGGGSEKINKIKYSEYFIMIKNILDIYNEYSNIFRL